SVEPLAQCRDFDPPDDVARKGETQKTARLVRAEAACTEIKQGIRIQLADCRAVTALYIVRVNFKLRLGVDHRVGRKQQVSIGLTRIRLLRVLVHDDFAVKHAVGSAVENTLVELP